MNLKGLSLSRLFFPLCIFFLLGTGYAFAEEHNLSFYEAVRVALQNNHELKAMQNAALASKEGVGIARSYLLPKVIFEERYLRTVNPGYAFMTKLDQQRIEQQDFNPLTLNHPDPVNNFQTSLAIEQPIFTRKGLVGLQMSKGESSAKQEELLRKQEQIAYQVAQAALTLQTVKSSFGATEKAVAEAVEHLRIAEVRYGKGMGQYADTLRAATSLSEAEQRRVSAEKNVRMAKRGLGLLLGMEGNVDLNDATPELPLLDMAAYEKAAETRRDVKSWEIHSDNAKKNIKLAEAGYFPYIGVGGAYQMNDPNRPLGSEGSNWQVTAFLRWDLFDGTKREYERAQAKYKAGEAQEQLSSLKKTISFRIYESYLNINEARTNMEISRNALKSAEEGKRLVRVRYENGLYPLIDLLNAQASLDQARANHTAREGEYRMAIVKLSYESGIIMKDLKIEP
ncbi:MAG: TolC family protein [Syntrophales bacterium]|jgi:outer membrane protein TolC|nr:TolC family protein [Syntrophales bacterium]MCK9391914.1 TolC family protein [Syntrophales bacterium]